MTGDDDTEQLPLDVYRDADVDDEMTGFSRNVVAYGERIARETADDLIDQRLEELLDDEFALDDLGDDLEAIERLLSPDGEPELDADAWEQMPTQDQHVLLAARLGTLREALEETPASANRGFW